MSFYFDYSTMVKWHGNPTGIPRTVYCLARAMREIDPGVKLVVIDDELGCFHDVSLVDDVARVGDKVDFVPGDVLLSVGANWAFGCYNEQVALMRAAGGHFYQLFYDIIPTLFPYFYEQGRAFGDYFGSWTLQTLALCDGAFAISECTRNDIARLVGAGSAVQSIKVVRLGEDFQLATVADTGQTDRFSCYDNFLLSVGTLEIRKNQACLLNAYRLMANEHSGRLPKLVLVGRKGWIDSDIAFQVANDRQLDGLVEVITDASDQELNTLYDRCLFTLFPALYEGWGLPVAESLKHGKPCISSNISSMLEIAPSLTRFASPFSAEAWAEKIGELLFDKSLLAAETERISAEYSPTSWRQTAFDIKQACN